MNPFLLVTDSNADMVPGFAAANHVTEMELTYTIDDKTYRCNDPALSRSEFYGMMRSGKMPITAQINLEEANAKLIPILDAGNDVLAIMFSSALSGTYNSVRLAAEELSPKYPNQKIIVIDSLCASAGLGLLIDRAVRYKESGLGLEDCAAKIREDILHIAHLFTVDDLFHLHRGGRVSATTAVVGSMLGIKPVLHVDDAGRLIPTGKVRGRKSSLMAMVNNMEKQIDREHCDKFFISHGESKIIVLVMLGRPSERIPAPEQWHSSFTRRFGKRFLCKLLLSSLEF